MIATFLTTQELIEEHWREVKPLIEPVVNHAAKGEFTLDDLYDMLKSGRAIAAIVHDQDTPIIAMVFEHVYYPRKTCINVMAIGGSNLAKTAAEFLHTFKVWALESGVSEIEACTSKAMTKLLMQIGFKHTYDIVRLTC